VYNAFEELRDEIVFVGGATVSLYTDREIVEPRPTDDIDVIIEIISYRERAALEEKLRDKGFAHDVESGIVCRYIVRGVIVDIMPTDDVSIGFKNQWYPEGFKAAIPYRIDERHVIRILPAPYFIATKLEAFNSRGGDGRTSQDFEDIVFVLEQRSSIWKELRQAEPPLSSYLKEEFSKWLSKASFFEWVDSHVERGPSRSTEGILDAINAWVTEGKGW
jgi:hypothetical protein